MKEVLITALGVGMATVIGSIIGFAFKKVSHKFSDVVMSFAAGIMLAAAVIGLILPSVELAGKWGLLYAIIGIFAGAICLNIMDKLIPHLHRLAGVDSENHNNANINKVMLFVLAIAIHNLPEGIAAGVGFGTGDSGKALLIASGIALQNIPEGMVIIAPMLAAGISPRKTMVCAIATGVVEVIGTLIGYLAVNIATVILPIALSFAGGTMLYVVSDEMLNETHAHGHERAATYSMIVGFCVMLVLDVLLR